MTITGTYFVFPSESKLNIDSTTGIVKIVLPTEEAILQFSNGVGSIIPEVIAYNIIGATINPVRFYRGGDKLWNGGAQYIEVTTDGEVTISSQDGIQSVIQSSSASSSFNNPYDFYLDGNVSVGGDGSFESPFKTLTELNNAVLLLPTSNQYVAFVQPFNNYGAEIVGDLLISENLSLIGSYAPSTIINGSIKLIASGAMAVVSQFTNLAFNIPFKLDLALAPFAFVSATNGQIYIDRMDNNPTATVIISSGVLGSTIIGGEVIIKDAYIFGDINISAGVTVYASNSLMKGGKFNLIGKCTLKTLSTFNPYSGYIDGTVDGSGTPSWLTDAASDESYTGTVNKTVY